MTFWRFTAKEWGLFAILVLASPLLVLGALSIKLACTLGRHEWLWCERLRVPCYGVGAWQCMFCERVKVKP